ncbi:hypothetical protein Lal_00014381 [Lupinus albus]|nr:hypothetical protein Lal_00014381 [Lupinus albus]
MTASRRVYLSLRERIVEMELLPGTRIVEKDLAEEFGTSRTPVHEAVQRLAEEGLIDVQARVGTFVSRIPLNTLEEAMLVRGALEVAIIEKAAERMTPEGIHKLNVVLERQAQCVRESNRRGFFRTDEAFHATLAELSGYPGVWQIILEVKTQIDRYRLLTLPLEGRMTEVLAEHRAVIDALASNNPKRAVRAMREHLDHIRGGGAPPDGVSRRPGNSNRQAELAEMLARRLMRKRIGNVLQRKRLIDHRLDAGCIDRADHVALVAPAADDQALQGLVASHQFDGRHRPGNTGEHTDQGDMAAGAACLDGLTQRVGPTHFDHVVDAPAVRVLEHLGRPVGITPVVDREIGAQCLRPREFVVGGRGCDHGCAHALGKLQRKDRHAARPEHQHGVARLQARVDHQRPPCGEPSRCQRRRLGVAVAAWRMREPMRRANDVFARIAVNAVAGYGRKIGECRAAIQPSREERRDNRIPHGKLVHALANRLHHPGAVGHRDTAVGARHAASHNAQVVKVQRAGMHAHADFSGARLARVGQVDEMKFVEASRLAQGNGFHEHDILNEKVAKGQRCKTCSDTALQALSRRTSERLRRRSHAFRDRRRLEARDPVPPVARKEALHGTDAPDSECHAAHADAAIARTRGGRRHRAARVSSGAAQGRICAHSAWRVARTGADQPARMGHTKASKKEPDALARRRSEPCRGGGHGVWPASGAGDRRYAAGRTGTAQLPLVAQRARRFSCAPQPLGVGSRGIRAPCSSSAQPGALLAGDAVDHQIITSTCTSIVMLWKQRSSKLRARKHPEFVFRYDIARLRIGNTAPTPKTEFNSLYSSET